MRCIEIKKTGKRSHWPSLNANWYTIKSLWKGCDSESEWQRWLGTSLKYDCFLDKCVYELCVSLSQSIGGKKNTLPPISSTIGINFKPCARLPDERNCFSGCALPESLDSGNEADTQSCPLLYMGVQYTQGFDSDLSSPFVSEQRVTLLLLLLTWAFSLRSWRIEPQRSGVGKKRLNTNTDRKI